VAQAEVDERTVLAWFCTQLPTLRIAADRDGWRGRLDREITAVQTGSSALRACRRLGLPIDSDQQKSPGSELASLAALGLESVTIAGDYLCPHGRCTRRAQADQQGRPPTCALDGTPMPLRPRP
jgi:hypothetical protein